MNKELIFVYNADSGIWNSLLDTAHKTLSPQTYSCHLCAITYDTLSMKKEWKQFIERLELPIQVLHRDEFKEQFDRDNKLPAVFVLEHQKLILLLDANKLNKMNLTDLIQFLEEKSIDW